MLHVIGLILALATGPTAWAAVSSPLGRLAFGNEITPGEPEDPPPEEPVGQAGVVSPDAVSGHPGGPSPVVDCRNGEPVYAADPVSPFTGRFVQRSVDLRLEGVYPIEIVRRYDSQRDLMTPLGWGWAFEHDVRLYDPPTDGPDVRVVRSRCGERYRYVYDGTAEAYLPDSATGEAWPDLVDTGSGFEWRHGNGMRYSFDANGLLDRRYNREGHYHQFSYTSEPQPIPAVDPYAVDPDPGDGVLPVTIVARSFVLESIEEFLADGTPTFRQVSFVFDPTLGRYTAVTTAADPDLPAPYDRLVTYSHLEAGEGDRGNLAAVTGPDGVTQSYTYHTGSGDPHNVHVFDHGDGTAPVTNTYDAQDRVLLQVIGNPAEIEFAFRYDVDEDPDDPNVITHEVERRVHVAGVPTTSRIAKFQYDLQGRLVGGDGATTFEIAYDSSVGNELERVLTYAKGTIEEQKQELEYDSRGKLIRRTTFDGATPVHEETWSWHDGWLVAHQVHGLSGGAPDPDDTFRTEYTFWCAPTTACADPPAPGEMPVGVKSVTEVDPVHGDRTTTIAIDAQHQVRSITLPDVPQPGPAPPQTLEIRREYYDHASAPGREGMLRRIYLATNEADPAPELEQLFEYDALARLSQLTDALGNATRFTWHDGGQIETIENALNEITRFTYAGPGASPPAGRLLREVTVGEGSPAEQRVRYRWDPIGRLTAIERLADPAAGGSYQLLAQHAYTQAPADAGLELAPGLLRTTTVYQDAATLDGRTTERRLDPWGRVTLVEDEAGNTTRTCYDALGRRRKVAPATATPLCSDSPISLRGARVFAYDPVGRLATTTHYSELDGTATLATTLAHDAAGHVTSVTDPKGQTTQYVVDALSQLREVIPEAVTDPSTDVAKTTYDYDARGRLATVTNGRGQLRTHVYEPWGPLARVEHDEDPGTSPGTDRTVSYSYDQGGNLTSVSDDRLQAGPLYTFAYDALNRVETTTLHYLPGGDRTLTSAYDAAGQRFRLAYADLADSPVQYWHHNTLGQLTGLAFASDGSGPQVQLARLDDDALETMTFPSGVTADFGYDGPTGVLDTLDVAQAGAPRFALDYAVPDALRRVTGVAESVGGGASEATSYGYDGFSRLDTVDYPPGGHQDASWAYDDAGNRDDAASPGSWSYNAANVLTGRPDTGYEVDDDGNLATILDTSGGTPTTVATLVWDADNRLVSHTAGGTTTTYAYDPFGRRLWKEVGADRTYYVWDGDVLLAEHDDDAAGTRLRRYEYAGGFAPVRMAVGATLAGESVYAVHSDHLATPRVLTDASGEVVWRARLNGYGSGAPDEDPDGDSQPLTFHIRFPGQYYDEETGLHYNRFRYYDASMGRYVSRDPIGQLALLAALGVSSSRMQVLPSDRGALNVRDFLGAEANLFAYSLNDPINLVDPSGELACGGLCIASIGFVATVGVPLATAALFGQDCDVEETASALAIAAGGIAAAAVVVGGAVVAVEAAPAIGAAGIANAERVPGAVEIGVDLATQGPNTTPIGQAVQLIVEGIPRAYEIGTEIADQH